MRLILVSSDGEVLDETPPFTRDEWDTMQKDSQVAQYTLDGLMAGKDAT